jgi:septum formation protein
MSADGPRIVLASASPRRRRLFAWYGVPYATTSVDVDESPDPVLMDKPAEVAAEIAGRKAAVARAQRPDDLLVSCDTIVVLGTEILGKPADLDDARDMLRRLSGRVHQVVTGIALGVPGKADPYLLSVVTNVHMHVLDDATIESWLAEGTVLGCAGAYNIERHLAWVDDDECFQNVAGLPLCHLYALLEGATDEWTAGLFERPDEVCDASRGAFCKLGPCMLGHRPCH